MYKHEDVADRICCFYRYDLFGLFWLLEEDQLAQRGDDLSRNRHHRLRRPLPTSAIFYWEGTRPFISSSALRFSLR